MQMESRVVSTLHSQPRPTTIVRLVSDERSSDSSEADPQRHDTLAAAIVIGLTAQFVTVLFGLVTDFIPGLPLNILLSSLIGGATGLIAYHLMK